VSHDEKLIGILPLALVSSFASATDIKAVEADLDFYGKQMKSHLKEKHKPAAAIASALSARPLQPVTQTLLNALAGLDPSEKYKHSSGGVHHDLGLKSWHCPAAKKFLSGKPAPQA